MALTADELTLLTSLVAAVHDLNARVVQLYAKQRGWENPETNAAKTALGTNDTTLDGYLATVVAET